jgi:hypothetical protein
MMPSQRNALPRALLCLSVLLTGCVLPLLADSATNTINTCNGNDCTSFLQEFGQSGQILKTQPAMCVPSLLLLPPMAPCLPIVSDVKGETADCPRRSGCARTACTLVCMCACVYVCMCAPGVLFLRGGGGDQVD